MDLAYFVIGSAIGLIVTLLSWRIYSLTKGGSRGWIYIAAIGIAMAFWSVSLNIYEILSMPEWLVLIIGSATFLVISLLAPLGVMALYGDMSLSTNRLFGRKPFIAVYACLLSALLAYNFLLPFQNPLRELYSICQVMLFLGFLFMSHGFWVLSRGTRKKAWMLMFVFAIGMTVSQLPSIYLGGCCGQGGPLVQDSACSGYPKPYVEVIPMSCDSGLVSVLRVYNMIDMIAFFIAVAGLFMLWKSMETALPKILPATKDKSNRDEI